MTTKVFHRSVLSSCIAVASLTTGVSAFAQTVGGEELLERVVVTGIRGSQEAAVDVKRDSTTIVDAIVAEDIGKLPDVTIADSLQRVTGVQIQREAGEGTSLNVRGMPQVLTTLNGEQFLSPWSITAVQANYTDIPAGMVSAVDVIKSQSATNSPGGISGIVDLKTIKPLRMDEGWTASAGLEGSEGDMTEELNHNVNAFVGWNGGQIGFTFGAFQSLSHSANYQMGSDLRLAFPNDGGDPLDLNNNERLDDRFLVPGEYGVNSYNMERERQGLATSFQADIRHDFTFTADIFYTKMEQFDRGVEANFNGRNGADYDVLRPGTETSQEAVLPGSGRVLNSLQVAVVEAPDFQATTRSQQNHTEALNTSFKLQYEPGNGFMGSVQYNYSQADREFENASFQQGTPEWHFIDEDGDGQNDEREPFLVTVDYTNEYPSFSFQDDLSSSERLNLFQGFADGTEQEATLEVFRADGTYEFNQAGFSSVEFGARFGRRDVVSSSFVYMAPTGRYSTYEDSRVPQENWFELLPGDYVWQRYPDWREFEGNPDLGLEPFDELEERLISFNDFGPFAGWEEGVAALDPETLDDVEGYMEFLYPGAYRFNRPSQDYWVVEDEISAYFQANFENDTGLFGVPFAGNLGVRVVETQREVVNAVTDTNLIPEEGTYFGGGYGATQGEPDGLQVVNKLLDTRKQDVSFTNVLPSANVNFFPTEDVILRLGFSQTMARNNLTNVGESESLWYQNYKVYADDGNQVDENGTYKMVYGVGGGDDRGNAELEPWRANNFNASAEWYFGDAGLLAAGLFMIDVDKATQVVQEPREYPDADGEIRRTANVWTTENTSSDLQGLELSYRQAMTFLPSVLADTGVEVNYTYSDSDSGNRDSLGKSFPLPSNSEHQSNLILWYQGDKLSSRLAYNWRSDVFQGQVGLLTNEEPIDLGNWTEPAGYVDASINYDLTDNFTVYFQGTNLTNTDNRNYAQFENQFQSLAVQERRLALGLRVSL